MTYKFRSDDRGTVTTFVLVMSVGMFLLAGLVIDFGRTFAAHSQMQGYADAMALAAARELDGESDAIARAQAVVDTAMIQLSTNLAADGDEAFEIANIYFLSDQPLNTGSPLKRSDFEGLITDKPELATHVLVLTEVKEIPWSLLAFTDKSDTRPTSPIRAAASATTERHVCTEPLLAICAPTDGSWDALAEGQQLRLNKNRGTNWEAGEYGVISDISDNESQTCGLLTGAARLTCLLAIDTHDTQCGAPANVDFQGDPLDGNGNDSIAVHAGLNTRFGIFDASLGSLTTDPNISADTNNIAGALYSCTGEVYNEVADTMSLPRDDCFHSHGCTHTGTVGDLAQLELYWERVHGGNLPAGLTTRYDVYLYELQNGLASVGEEGDAFFAGASCNPNSSSRANRRSIEVAIVDCSNLNASTVTDQEVLHYAEVFMTEPVTRESMFVATFDGTHSGHTFSYGQELDGNLIGATQVEATDPETGDVTMSWASNGGGSCRWGGDAHSETPAANDMPGMVCPEGSSLRPYADVGLTFTVFQSRRAINDGRDTDRNHAMTFDTANYTGGDSDLQHTQFGHILIVSEDGHTHDPDDEGKGSWLIMEFSEPTYVEALTLFDADNGGVVRIYDQVLDAPPYGEFGTDNDGNLYAWNGDESGHDDREVGRVAVPKMHDGEHFEIGIQMSDVRTIAYFMPNSGGIDNIEFWNSLTGQVPDGITLDEMYVEFRQYIDAEDRRVTHTTKLSN